MGLASRVVQRVVALPFADKEAPGFGHVVSAA